MYKDIQLVMSVVDVFGTFRNTATAWIDKKMRMPEKGGLINDYIPMRYLPKHPSYRQNG